MKAPKVENKASRLLHFLGIIAIIITAICDIAEFLAVPTLLLIIGLLNSFTREYYVISIGAYIAIFVLLETIARFTFKALDKKYTPLIKRKLNKYFNKNN
ncbi:MAG: hypothetical protein IJX97_01675 [Clostridia bacterium]|nr:hypothetical protein [Clostridia bacterium]